MATVRLGRYEVEHGSLPSVCMACGEPATLRKSKKFSWYPPWVIAFILIAWPICLVLMLVLTKKMKVAVPFCERHRHYFLLRNGGILGSLVFIIVAACGGHVAMIELEGKGGSDIIGSYLIGFGAIFLVWLVAILVVSQRSIHPTEITDRSMTLVHVAEEFAKAVNQSRMGPREEDYPEVVPVDPRRPEGGEPGRFYDPNR